MNLNNSNHRVRSDAPKAARDAGVVQSVDGTFLAKRVNNENPCFTMGLVFRCLLSPIVNPG